MVSILIFYRDENKSAELLQDHVTEVQAKRFCKLPSTSDRDAGWFCGWNKEDDGGWPRCSDYMCQKLRTIFREMLTR